MCTSDWLHMHTWQGMRRHMTWEQWHIYYSEPNNLFTLYINLPNWVLSWRNRKLVLLLDSAQATPREGA